jgi:apolipoprotein N-acyltransferase
MKQDGTNQDRTVYLWLALFALFSLFSGKWTLAPATWLAPVFALRFLRSQKTGRGFLLLFVAAYIPISLAWYEAAPIPMPIYPIFVAINVLLGSLPYLFDRLLTPRFQQDGNSSFFSTLVFPFAATAVEYLLMADGPLGSFGASAYSQAGFPILAQLASITSLWGITFLVAWFASVVNWAWERNFAWKSMWRGVVVYAAILGIVLTYGAVRLLNVPDAGDTVTIASFTANEVHPETLFPMVEEDLEAFRAETTQTHQRYLDQTVQAAQDGAKIVLWPELAAAGTADDVQALLERGQAVAQQEGIYLAMPTMTFYPGEERPAENILYIADPQGDIVLKHVKYGGNILEGTLLGSRELQTIETPYGTLSGVICWDTDYPTVMAQAGRQGVDILLSPAHIWPAISKLHADMAGFRAIENGMSVIRQADQGVSRYIDSMGRTVASADAADNETGLLADVSTSGFSTIYPQFGDIIGQASVVGFLLIAAWALVAGRRRRKSSEDLETSNGDQQP